MYHGAIVECKTIEPQRAQGSQSNKTNLGDLCELCGSIYMPFAIGRRRRLGQAASEGGERLFTASQKECVAIIGFGKRDPMSLSLGACDPGQAFHAILIPARDHK